MRFIVVPHAIMVIPPPDAETCSGACASPCPLALAGRHERPESWSFRKYSRMWLDDTAAYRDGEGFSFSKQVRWAEVIKKFLAAEPGGVIELEDQDYEVLKKIVERPTRSMQGTAAVQCLGFSQAVLSASKDDPRQSTATTAAANGQPGAASGS